MHFFIAGHVFFVFFYFAFAGFAHGPVGSHRGGVTARFFTWTLPAHGSTNESNITTAAMCHRVVFSRHVVMGGAKAPRFGGMVARINISPLSSLPSLPPFPRLLPGGPWLGGARLAKTLGNKIQYNKTQYDIMYYNIILCNVILYNTILYQQKCDSKKNVFFFIIK